MTTASPPPLRRRGSFEQARLFLLATARSQRSLLRRASRTSVVPFVPSVALSPSSFPATHAVGQPQLFELVTSYPLRELDLSQLVRTWLLGPHRAAYLEHFLRYQRVICIPFMAGLLGVVLFSIAPTRLGRPGLVVSIALVLPLIVDLVTAPRIDLVRLMLRTHEFWFFSLINTIIWLAHAA